MKCRCWKPFDHQKDCPLYRRIMTVGELRRLMR